MRFSSEAGSARLLDRMGQALLVPVTTAIREDADGSVWRRAQLALAPLAERGLLADVVISAMQGVSGAGRGGGDAMHYVSMDENAFAYKT